MTYRIMLDTVDTLVLALVEAKAHERKDLYGAVQVLLVHLVERLDRAGCNDEALYQRCGELLDHCSCLAGLRSESPSRGLLLLARQTVSFLRSGLSVNTLAC